MEPLGLVDCAPTIESLRLEAVRIFFWIGVDLAGCFFSVLEEARDPLTESKVFVMFVEFLPKAMAFLLDCFVAAVAGVLPFVVRLLGARWTTGEGLTALLKTFLE